MSPVNLKMPKPDLHDPVNVELRLTDLAKLANLHHGLAVGHVRSAIDDSRAAGDALAAAKSQIAHGGFEAWVKQNCQFSKSTAHRYMFVAENWEAVVELLDSSDALAQMSLRGIERLIRQSRSADQQATIDDKVEIETGDALSAEPDTDEFPQHQSDPATQLRDQLHKTKDMVATFRAQTKLLVGDGRPGSDDRELTAMTGGPLNELIEELEGLGRQLAISPVPSSPPPPAASKSQPSPQPSATPAQAEKRSPRHSRPIEPHCLSPYSSNR